MSSAAARQFIDLGGLHPNQQGVPGVIFLVLTLVDSQDAEDVSENPFEEVLVNRLGGNLRLHQFVKDELRPYLSQFVRRLGNKFSLPTLEV